MLDTTYTKSGGTTGRIIANNPRTGTQIEIDPDSQKGTSPANVPLTNFTVNGYQSVTVN
ncbi:MAG TPA: hypothetical protein VHD14_06170 [Pseudolabrys sp.]|nr:hypothetical protein [Pseudolabrys sp.]